MKKIAFLGLGVMGYPMAGHLQKAGFDVCVYNRTIEKAKQWSKHYGGTYAQTPAKAVINADIVLACVGADKDLLEITIGNGGAFEAMRAGAIFIDHTTTSDTVAKKLYSIAKTKRLEFIDAPVSGGQMGAENAILTIMCGGDNDVFEIVKPLMDTYANHCGLIGDIGAGQQCKMINQIVFTHVLQGLSEGISFAKQAGLDTNKVYDAISGGAAGSWQMNNRWKTMVKGEFDFGFAIDWGLKDLNLVLDCAESMKLDVPTTRQLRDSYRELQEQGHGRDDTSALIRRYVK